MYKKNGNLILMDLDKKVSELILTPEPLVEKMKVDSATSHWFDEETLIFLGGSEPPLGNGGRSIIVYSSNPIVSSACALENCIMVDTQNVAGTEIECDECGSYIHQYCDSKVRDLDAKSIEKMKYICPMCRPKPTSKNSRKRGYK